ncbi:phosphotriesterase family protein [Subtercola boreus]|uniref:phosphotriesterase family protein n=1 Tax=Subtercola boreus TaxID=120213 RepID=UPI001559CFA1|nr:hypothetical protein [Subtercola boreus]
MTAGFIRTVLGDTSADDFDVVYAHEHVIIDSPLIAAAFPHIHLFDEEDAVTELSECRHSGVGLMLDAMPCSSGRVIDRLARISARSGVAIVAATGLHHDRYYGPLHWSNRVSVDALAELFVADLTEGIDLFDYASPVIERTDHRAGVIKVATSGEHPDARDRRNLEAAAQASVVTGAPIITHCEGGTGAIAQVELLNGWGVAGSQIILSHVDKIADLSHLRDIASTGAVLECDQSLRQADKGVASLTAQAICALVTEGFGSQVVVGTDGARRSLWRSLGGEPGLAWLATELPLILTELGLDVSQISAVMGGNAARALTWKCAPTPSRTAREYP